MTFKHDVPQFQQIAFEDDWFLVDASAFAEFNYQYAKLSLIKGRQKAGYYYLVCYYCLAQIDPDPEVFEIDATDHVRCYFCCCDEDEVLPIACLVEHI